MSVLTPGRGGRLDGLLGRMFAKKFGGRGELKTLLTVVFAAGESQILLAMGRLADQRFQKKRAFEPPVAKQFGVEWRHDDGIEIERAHFVQLLAARFEEMSRVNFGHPRGGRRIVELF